MASNGEQRSTSPGRCTRSRVPRDPVLARRLAGGAAGGVGCDDEEGRQPASPAACRRRHPALTGCRRLGYDQPTMVTRRRVLQAMSAGLLAGPFAVEAQQPRKIYRIGLVSLGARPTPSGVWQNLLDAMRDLNYVEGQNLVTRLALAEGKPERLAGLVADLMQAKVDVIVTTSTQETLAAKRATSMIPIVMTLVPDPVEQGLVASLARPGGNVTGLTTMAPGASQKLVELLRDAVPSALRFGVLRIGGSPFPEIRRELQAAA